MKRLFMTAAGAGLCLFSLAGLSFAQNDWYHNRDSFFRGNEWKMHLFDRVRDDLNHVESDTFKGSDRARIDHTKMELNELQAKLASHRYDQPQLDEVIGGLQMVMADNRLRPDDRNMLNDDLSRLRDYREHHENWR